jgi:hypothetical protein
MDYKILPFLGVITLACVPVPALAAVTIFTTNLGSAGEPVPTSTATGTAVVSFDDVLNKVSVAMSFTGLANNAPFGHIHCCTAVAGTGNASVALGFNPLPAVTTGSYTDSFMLTPTAFASLLAGTSAGKAYVNIHTPGTYAAGEIRGFLRAAVVAVPEPQTWSFMIVGFGLLGASIRNQRRRSTVCIS